MATHEQDIKNESRLKTLEIELENSDELLKKMNKDIEDIKEDLAQVKTTIAKAGGILLGFTMIGAFIGYLLTQLDKLKHLIVGN